MYCSIIEHKNEFAHFSFTYECIFVKSLTAYVITRFQSQSLLFDSILFIALEDSFQIAHRVIAILRQTWI